MSTETIFGVRYRHIQLAGGADLYVTELGEPLLEWIRPENFYTDKEWFNANHVKLPGTSSPYRIRTKSVSGQAAEVVFKWNRMGQKVIREEEGGDKLAGAEFNSPFEEFALVMELRASRFGAWDRIRTQNPLAIYVPLERAELWELERTDHRMQALTSRHQREVELDIYRGYAVIYQWLPGVDLAQARSDGVVSEEEMKRLSEMAEEDLRRVGFLVRDQKAQHVIVRPDTSGKRLQEAEDGRVIYGLVDFELMERTPERELMVRRLKRRDYLKRQKDRFHVDPSVPYPPHLRHVEILGVEYVFGRAESTKGLLWVVGLDPELFDYFLPERWEDTPRIRLSSHGRYYTVTKDNIHLVWRVSRVGETPDMDPYRDDEKRILDYGYNSPFEEVSIALDLARSGIRTTYPRAIYMSGTTSEIASALSDDSRYGSHERYRTPDGEPVLQKDHAYTIIWGYWNGPDERLAARDSNYLEGINALQAYRAKLISEAQYLALIQRKRERLREIGIEDLNMRGTHILLSRDTSGVLVLDANGYPEMRVCNFELLKRVSP